MPPKKQKPLSDAEPPAEDKPRRKGRTTPKKGEEGKGTKGYHAARGEERRDGRKDVRLPTDGKPGNSKQDQAWLEEQLDAGMIIDIDEDELNIPFGAMKRWTGRQEDVGSLWVLPPEERRCKGRARIRDGEGRMILDIEGEILMRPCTRWAIPGGNVCTAHGGGVAHVQQAARLRLIAAADPLIGALIKIALDETQDAKARVAAINSALDRAGITGKIEVEVDTPKWQEMLAGMFDGEWKKE